MGIVAVGQALGRGILGALGIGGTAVARAGPGLVARTGTALAGAAPSLLGGAAAGLGFSALTSAFGGNGAVAAQPGAIVAPAAAPQMVVLDDGSRILVSKQGVPMRAQLFLPISAKLPGGARIVSVSADGQIVGIRKGRRKRPAFKTEIETCKSTISAAKSLVKAAKG